MSRKFFEPKVACEKMGHHHNLIITPLAPAHLDCMGKRVSLNAFCMLVKEELSKPLLRGYVDPVTNQVVCEGGSATALRLECPLGADERLDRYCMDHKPGCQRLGELYAQDLELSHSAFLEAKLNAKQLTCHFSAKVESEQGSEFEILPISEKL